MVRMSRSLGHRCSSRSSSHYRVVTHPLYKSQHPWARCWTHAAQGMWLCEGWMWRTTMLVLALLLRRWWTLIPFWVVRSVAQLSPALWVEDKLFTLQLSVISVICRTFHPVFVLAVFLSPVPRPSALPDRWKCGLGQRPMSPAGQLHLSGLPLHRWWVTVVKSTVRWYTFEKESHFLCQEDTSPIYLNK